MHELVRQLEQRDPSSSLRLTLAGLALRGVQVVTSFAAVIVLARSLGAEGRGEYFLFVAALAVLTRLVDLGMSPAAVVYAGRFPESAGSVHAILLKMVTGLWLAACVIGAVVFWLFGGVQDRWLLVLLLL